MSIVEELKQQREQAANDYATLVEQIATGQRPDTSAANAILTAAGRTPEDLARDIERRHRKAKCELALAENKKIADAYDLEMKTVGDMLEQSKRERDAAIQRAGEAAVKFNNLHGLKMMTAQRRTALEAELRSLQTP